MPVVAEVVKHRPKFKMVHNQRNTTTFVVGGKTACTSCLSHATNSVRRGAGSHTIQQNPDRRSVQSSSRERVDASGRTSRRGKLVGEQGSDDGFVVRPPEFHVMQVFLYRQAAQIPEVEQPAEFFVPATDPLPVGDCAPKPDQSTITTESPPMQPASRTR